MTGAIPMDDQLALLKRGPSSQQPPTNPPVPDASRHLLRRWSRRFPLVLLALLILALGLSLGPRLIPARSVEWGRVIALSESRPVELSDTLTRATDSWNGETLFQASGWIEPDPYSVEVNTLTSGVIASVWVREGESVEEGQLIAMLDAEDARLAHEQALALLKEAEASLQSAREAVVLSRRDSELAQYEMQSQQSREAEARDRAERALQLGVEVLPEQEIIQARLRLETELARTAASAAALEGAAARLALSQSREAEAKARLEAATTRAATARLALERTQVRAPITGRIQRLLVRPGQKRMLMADDPLSGSVAVMYDPEKLQARIDIPLAEAAKVRVGTAVLIETEFLADSVFRGSVRAIEGQADLQRNTLQVKVALEDPDERLRPEMLCRARFLDTVTSGRALDTGNESSLQVSQLGLYLPPAALLEDASGPYAWALDAAGARLEKRSLQLGQTLDGTGIRVRSGLRPGDSVVLNPSKRLREGMRVHPPKG
jgi:HlyD family secretion protein